MVLLICGAGQYGAVAKEVAEAIGQYTKILFLDDNSDLTNNKDCENKCVVGKLAAIDDVEYDAGFVAIGNPMVRKALCEKLTNLATLIHPRATVMPSAVIGAGSLVEAGAMVGTNAKIGAGAIVMVNAVVGHDAQVGEYCQLKYGCVIPERCQVPERTKVDCNVVYDEEKICISNG